MQLDQTQSLLREAREAADPRAGSLHCYADLQDLLVKLATVTEALATENEVLSGRLRRNHRDADGAPRKSQSA